MLRKAGIELEIKSVVLIATGFTLILYQSCKIARCE